MKQQLPIGIQSFKKLREDNLLYVDKTEILYRLTRYSNYFFLSRPRRFGKSLTLSTLKELFSGQQALFEGLWIYDHWNWEETHPVIHISFSSIGYKELGLEKAIEILLQEIAQDFGIALLKEGISQMLEELIQQLSSHNRVILLIDEYDKPIVDYLDDIQLARENQQILKSFYSIIKDADPYIRFLMITGVSKFSKVSIFSELNNLTDLTIHPKFTTLVGYTQAELENYFEEGFEELAGTLAPTVADVKRLVKDWYNGYSWDGKNFVYNPFSILSFFGAGEIQYFWFSTGTPTFLVNLLKERNYYDVGPVEVGQAAFDSFDIENIDTHSLLFQTGYLTIKSVEPFGLYVLDYPNKEVKDSMLQYLVAGFSHGAYSRTTPIVIKLRKAFLDNEMEQVIAIINGLFKSIPSQIFIKEKEAYYHSVVFLVFQYLGQFIDAEVNTSDGRIDAVVQTPSHIYVLEFKLDESASAAIQQISKKGYLEKYANNEKQVLGIGINFSSVKKCVDDWERVAL
ncbi:MAG TPA: AAA family ATPase [Saprospiraceae bacterium]|nr:AAA family ATPase [Saprospiraceae bacterium]HMQ84234.1 AAA family ATPase [Saprospiraceae bacterium]